MAKSSARAAAIRCLAVPKASGNTAQVTARKESMKTVSGADDGRAMAISIKDATMPHVDAALRSFPGFKD